MSAFDADIAQQLQQGFDGLNRGQLEIAAKACQPVLSERPELAPAHFLVDLITVEGDERCVAHEAFKSVVKIEHNVADAVSGRALNVWQTDGEDIEISTTVALHDDWTLYLADG